MPVNNLTHFVLVDFENVPTVDLDAVAGKPVQVILLIGAQQNKIPLTLVRQIHRLAAQVELVEVGASGRNALDLTLACYLGQCMRQHPGAVYHIVSKDKDFDPLIVHLQAKQVGVSRHDSFAALPLVAPAKKSSLSRPSFPVKTPTSPKPTVQTKLKVTLPAKTPVDKYPKLLEQIRRGKNLPATRERLMHHIHTLFGQKASVQQQLAVVNRLSSERIIQINAANQVTYLSP